MYLSPSSVHTSSCVSKEGWSFVGLVKLATIAATVTCLLPSAFKHPGCEQTRYNHSDNIFVCFLIPLTYQINVLHLHIVSFFYSLDNYCMLLNVFLWNFYCFLYFLCLMHYICLISNLKMKYKKKYKCSDLHVFGGLLL